MKTSKHYSNKTNDPPRHASGALQNLALVALIGTSLSLTLRAAEVPAAPAADANAQGVQVLTRGPVHEAFAGVVTFNPEPGIVVPKAPPAIIDEVPPGERPEGDNVTWIPGYWAWDEERTDFVWVSGTWRALPPGRQWIAGYWGETTQGYQWTSGYWADASVQETTYLPQPPATVEEGPSVAAPSEDYRWTPGNWVWNQDRYAWGPGYWARGRADWDWSPSHYMWTPRGYVFVDGYWDYPVNRRGSLFAPVYFDSGVYSQSGYSYSPSIAIDLAVFAEALFLRPRYNHYYFGDYYDNSYQQGGYYSAYAYQSNRFGYDSIYSHQRWEHRQDQGWDNRMAASYQYRRDNVNARPPRTWAAQQAIASTSEFKQNRMLVAAPLDQIAKQKNGGVRYQAVTKSEKQALAQRGQQVGQFRDQRRTLETKGGNAAAPKTGEAMAATKVEHAKSPIVAKSPNQLGKGNAPPAAPRTPKLVANAQPNAQPNANPTGRQPGVDKTNPLPEPRKTAVTPNGKQPLSEPQPRKTAVKPNGKQPLPEPQSRRTAVTPNGKQPLPEPQPRKTAVTPSAKVQPQPEPRKTAVMPSAKVQPQPQPQPRKTAVAPSPKVQPQPQPQPRKTTVAPSPKVQPQPQPQPRKTAVAPSPKVQPQPQPQPRKVVVAPSPRVQPQPQPRQPAAAPRQPAPAPRQAPQPAANQPASHGGGGANQPGEKDPKKKGKE